MQNGRPRLESWKEIAGYLGRTVRTVQRWEAQEGLPVHRQLHQSSGNVFAYPDELDRWIAARQSSPGKPADDEAANGDNGSGAAPVTTPAMTRRWHRRWLFPAAAVAVVVLIVGGWLMSRLLRPREPVWLLVTALDNRTGEALLDDSVPYLLEREIGNSPGIFVTPRGRVEDTLRLMRRDLNTKVDEAVAREICQRDGEIRLIAVSRAERIGSAWLLSVGVIDASGRSLGGTSEQVRTIEEIPAAARRLGSAVRQRVSDVAPAQADAVDHVTTRSLRAAQLLSRAIAEDERLNYKVAEQLEREALAEDEDFAAAHIWLARSLWRQGKRIDSRQHMNRAVALAGTATERERWFIRLSEASMNLDSPGAIEIGNRMVATYPDDYRVRAELANALSESNRHQEAAEQHYLASNLRPNSYFLGCTAFYVAMDWGNVTMASRLAKRLAALDPVAMLAGCARGVRAFPLHQRWLNGNVEDAKLWSDKVSAAAKSDIDDPLAAGFYLSLGRLTDARRMFARTERAPTSAQLVWDYLRDDPASMRTSAAALKFPVMEPAGALLIQPGMTLAEAVQRFQEACGQCGPAIPRMAESRRCALNGDIPGALAALAEFKKRVPGSERRWYVVQLSLARAYELAGDPATALTALSSADRGPEPLLLDGGIAFWQRLKYEQARLMRKLGRAREAEPIEAALRRELRFADPDHPIVKRLSQPDRQPFQVY